MSFRQTKLCIKVSSVLPQGKKLNSLNKSFFYQTHMLWNSLPLEIREIKSNEIFKQEVKQHLWKMAFDEIIDNDIDTSLYFDAIT